MDLQVENELEVQQPKYRLNAGQQAAFDWLVQFCLRKTDFRKVLLAAYAGYGKSFLINRVMEYLLSTGSFNIGMTAPTHKAVRVLKKMSEFKERLEFGTIHSFLALKEHIDDNGVVTYKPDFQPGRSRRIDEINILIVDESSQLHDILYEYIETELRNNPRLIVIFLGDLKQIPKIRSKEEIANGLGRDAIPFIPAQRESRKIHLLTLTEPQRQSLENPILQYAQAIRDNIKSNYIPFKILPEHKEHLELVPRTPEGLDDLIRRYFKTDAFKEDSDYVKIVAWRNATVDFFNKRVRLIMYDATTLPKIIEGECLLMDKPVLKGRTVVLSKNEEILVTKVIPGLIPIDYKIFKLNNFFAANQPGNDDQLDYYVKQLKCKTYHTTVESEEDIYLLDILHEDSEAEFNKMLDEVKNCALKTRDVFQRKEMWKQFYGLQEKVAWTKYNYALTAHTCQGSTYTNTISMEWDIDVNPDYEERNRIKYTSSTRSTNKLFIIK